MTSLLSATDATKEKLGAGGPLCGLTVLDLTQFLSGPYATQIMGDLGAKIIKIESPQGDSTRTMPPHFFNGESAYYLSTNRNKESIVLDLKKPRGQALFQEMVKKADVVLDNWRPGVMNRLGADYPTISKINPRIIACSITGFGQTGPYRERPAYDMIVQALSGGMSLTGEAEGRPVRAGIPIGDLCAGMFGVIGILAALSEREQSGLGQFIDVAMLDVQISMLSYQAVYYFLSQVVPGPQDRGHLSIPTYRSFLAKDGVDVLITAITENMWQSLCKVLERADLLADPRFATSEDRLGNKQVLLPILQQCFLQKESGYWLKHLEETGIPCAPVNTLDRALLDPQVKHRDMVIEVDHPKGGRVRLTGDPLKLSRTQRVQHSSPPLLGQHTESILRDFLGLGPEEVQQLAAEGIVGRY